MIIAPHYQSSTELQADGVAIWHDTFQYDNNGLSYHLVATPLPNKIAATYLLLCLCECELKFQAIHFVKNNPMVRPAITTTLSECYKIIDDWRMTNYPKYNMRDLREVILTEELAFVNETITRNHIEFGLPETTTRKEEEVVCKFEAHMEFAQQLLSGYYNKQMQVSPLFQKLYGN